ncbi:MAG: restriction endonuclease subunit S [Planctomycetes bacterium]|nr:restriction endonuclease subunit S [Planctomycetota bacterium]
MDLTIPLPPLPQQRRIVAKIERLAAKIDEARSLVEKRTAETECVLSTASRELLSNNSWEWRTVERACKQMIDYRGRTPPIAESGIPHITSANVKNGQIDWTTSKFVTEATYADYMTRGIPKRGDVVFTMEAPLGDAAALKDDRRFSLAQRTLLLRGKSGQVDGEFLARAMTTPAVKEAIYAKATGTTVKGIASKRLKHILIPVPPIPEQRRIVAYLDGLQAKLDELKQLAADSAAELDAILPAILDRAFKGEL